MNNDLIAPELEIKKNISPQELAETHRNWYLEKAHPFALKRAQFRFQLPWILESIQKNLNPHVHILDVGCGAGVLANNLGLAGHDVTAIDMHPAHIQVAEQADETRRVKYVQADSGHLPFPEECFDVVTAMDIFCQLENPQKVLNEISRVLRPGGLLFFHAFNQNLLSYLAVAKGTGWFVKNTPKKMHEYSQFLDPIDFEDMLEDEGLDLVQLKGLRPALDASVLKTLWTREIADDFKFKWSGDYSLSYAGFAKKLRAN